MLLLKARRHNMSRFWDLCDRVPGVAAFFHESPLFHLTTESKILKALIGFAEA